MKYLALVRDGSEGKLVTGYDIIYVLISRCIFAQRSSNGHRQPTHIHHAQRSDRCSMFRVVGLFAYRKSASLS